MRTRMDTVISLFVLSTLPQLLVLGEPSVTSFRAVVEMVSGDSRIFSGESVRLKCSIPDIHRSTWSYLWFKGSEKLPQQGEHFTLWRAHIKESGKYYCQGVRDTVVGNIKTLPSLPLEIRVDGGWAILRVPPHPSLVGHTSTLTCRVRGDPQLNEVILYKDGVEFRRQNGPSPHFHLTNLNIRDQGIYSCRASWDIDRRTRSVISADTPLQVLEVLSQPVLEIVTDPMAGKQMKLICHVQYNAPVPVPPIHYYFYRNNNRLGTATSENHDLFRQSPGQYSCKAKVPELGLSRLSEPKNFGQETGPETMMPPVHLPRDLLPLAPPTLSPNLSLPSPEETTHTSAPSPTPSQQSTLLSAYQSPTQTAVPQTTSEKNEEEDECDDTSEESGDIPYGFNETVLS